MMARMVVQAAACGPGLERPLDPAFWHGMHTRTLVADRPGVGCSTDPGSGRDLARPRSARASPARSRSAGRRPTAPNPPGGTGSSHTSPPVTVMPDRQRSDRPDRVATPHCDRLVRQAPLPRLSTRWPTYRRVYGMVVGSAPAISGGAATLANMWLMETLGPPAGQVKTSWLDLAIPLAYRR